MNKKISSGLALGLFLVALFLPFTFVSAGSASCDVTATNSALATIITNVTNMAQAVGTAVAVIGFIVAGIIYLTAGGGERMSIAKKALIGAVIGTFLVAAALGANVLRDIFCALFKT